MLRHPLTRSWVPVPEAKSNSGRWFRSTSGGLGRKSVVVGARCPSCTTNYCYTTLRLRKMACPIDTLFAAMDAVIAGLRGS
jgi:hypothetical protein